MTSLTDTEDPQVYYKTAEKYISAANLLFPKQTSKDEADYGILGAMLGAVRGLYNIHQAHHWQVQGTSFYADHLLFQRLYEGILPEIDSVAEKLVGVAGPVLTNFFLQQKLMEQFMTLAVTSNPSTPLHENGLRAELLFLALTNLCIATLKDKNLLSSGLEQTLGTVAEKHEEHTFLLQQRVE